MHNTDILIKGLKEIGIDPSGDAVEKLFKYKDILLEWNERINLTAIVEEKEIYIKHFLDSATCVSTGYLKAGMSAIDVGTGAGFPGIPVKLLMSEIDLTLLDSLNKRISYLKDACSRLDISNVELVHSRAEEAGARALYREKYDIALSRAVAPMNILMEYCLPFVKVNGYFLCQKGPNCEDELKEAQRAIKTLGGEVAEVKSFMLPFSDIKHYIIVVAKKQNIPSKYPRKPGKPASDPII